MTTDEILDKIQTHVCCIHGTYYTFDLDSATMVPGTPHWVLEIIASRLDPPGPPRVTAIMRVMAAEGDLHRVRLRLNDALREWLSGSGSVQPAAGGYANDTSRDFKSRQCSR